MIIFTYFFIQDKFDVDKKHMKLILRSAATKWGDFKSKLTTDYMYVDKEKTQIRTQPPLKYPFIDQDNWAEFIKQRCSKEFQVSTYVFVRLYLFLM